MPFEPLRFVHAAGLALDRQPVGLQRLPDDLVETVQDATLIAFERVVSAAVEQNADFLLLTGNSFHEQERSLRARLALRKGFERLAEHGIRAFAVPGLTDPAEAWHALADLPDNVTTLTPADDPVAVLRDGRLVATIAYSPGPTGPAPHPGPKTGETGSNGRRSPFRVGVHFVDETSQWNRVLPPDADRSDPKEPSSDPGPAECDMPFDYLALGGRDRRYTLQWSSGFVHDPGPVQALGPETAGPTGASVVDVAADGTIRCAHLPAAPLRWHGITVEIDAHSHWGQLVERMRQHIEPALFTEADRVLCLRWTIVGSGPLHDELSQGQRLQELIDCLPERRGADDGCRIVHSVRLLLDPACLKDVTPGHALADQYFQHLESIDPLSPAALAALLAEARQADEVSGGKLQELMDHLDRRCILNRARQLGVACFGPNSESGAR